MVAMSRRRTRAAATLALGLALLTLMGLWSGARTTPLLDGVVVEEPYRYLQPPSGAPGDPLPVTESAPVSGGQSPNLYSATAENPPQAQLIADQGAFTLPTGTTSVKASIQAVPPPLPVPTGQVAGNVYAMTVTNQSGTNLALQSGKTLTIVLRAPSGVTVGTIYEFAGSGWTALQTQNGGLPDMFAANATSLGAFAVVVAAPASASAQASVPAQTTSTNPTATAVPVAPPPADHGPSLFVLIGIAAAVLGLGLLSIAATVARGPGDSQERPRR
jgi:hypothetical protein